MKYILAICLIINLTSFAYADSAFERGKDKSVTCSACHGTDGNSETKMYPKLAGQYKNYLVHALSSYKNGDRKNAIMSGFAAGLSDQDIIDLSTYYSKQKGLNIIPK
tara:strand:+ start:73 stop:393 length:321 start_codon:yes stop_codon:yes gene_type:complete